MGLTARPERGTKSRNGFTLLELILVIAIIGITLALVFPRLSGISRSYLKTDAGRVSTLIRYLNEAAVTKKLYYRLRFDLEGDSIRVESSRDGRDFTSEADPVLQRLKLSDAVVIEDIVVPDLGKIDSGEVAVVLAPGGAADPFTIHLRADNHAMTLSFNPYSGSIKAEEGYI